MPFFDQSRKGSLNQDVVQHFAKPLHKVTNHRRNGKIRHWTWPCIRGSKFLHIILFFCIARIGEAQNPGPTIGTINPSGALGKGHLFQDLPNVDQFNAWGIAETHLTNPGLVKFRQELHHQPDPWRFTPGAPAPPLTSSPGVVGGKATGVGLLSTCPARPLAGRWKTEDWQTGRIQTVAAFVQHQWVKMGLFYGFAKDAHTKAVQEKSDKLLSNLTDRIIRQSQGYRAIMGDFNQTPQALAQFEIWRAHGFQEIQSIAQSRWNQPQVPTCKKKTIKDLIWLSPELADKLTKVVVDDTYFADHAIVYGVFSDFGPTKPLPIWRKPKSLPWDDVEDFNPEIPAVTPSTYEGFFHELESMVDHNLRLHGKPGLIEAQKGRGLTTTPTWVRYQVTPNRPSRSKDFEIQYLGENYQHTKWCRQLRRLQSLVAILRSSKNDSATSRHRHQLWQSIRAATGFPGGFPFAWKNREHQTGGTPKELPKRTPDLDTAQAIFLDFQLEFRTLEKALNGKRLQSARERRAKDGNIIYHDVGRERAMPVQTVVTQTHATVTDILHDGLTLHYEPTRMECSFNVSCKHGQLQVAEHSPGVIKLQDYGQVEIGDTIMQPRVIGDVLEVFQAFQRLWMPMWNRHETTEPSRWEPFVHNMLQQVPSPAHEMPLQPISENEWTKAINGKRKRTATGPDGVSKLDLSNMPPCLQTGFVELINEFDSGSKFWPEAALIGHISSVEKTPGASAPQEFRPITVLTLPYRVWATIRAKQCLQWIDKIGPPGLHGNRPEHGTSTIWWHLSMQIEAATFEKSPLSGLVTDISKCYNNLARPIVYACARHLGIPFSLVKSWHDAVDKVQRFFIVTGCCSSATPSCTGYPEGDPMSVVAMALINCAMHYMVEHATPTKTLSFVDNWEAISTSIASTHQAYNTMEDFTRGIDLTLDHAKTHFWATQGEDRKWLRSHSCQVALHAKDLGAHLNYARRPTNYTIRARIAKAQAFWGQLARSTANINHKLKAIVTVAWPRCLYGISVSPLGVEHYGRLRSQAMTAMKWNMRGASSTLQFGLVLHPRYDPAFHALVDTILTFRNHCIPEVAFPILTGLTAQPPRHFDPGPCGILLTRLHEINWKWCDDGFCKDHEGLTMHLLDSPIQTLKMRLCHAWERTIGCNMQSRKEYTGLCRVDAAMTRQSYLGKAPDAQGLVRTVLNGTFHTRDKQIYTCKVPSVSCSWCGENDGVEHRLWECPQFAACRNQLSEHVRVFWQHNQNVPHYTDGWLSQPVMQPSVLNLPTCQT